jgi:hypothetical protein
VTLLGGKKEGRPSDKDIGDMIKRLETAWRRKEPVRGDFGAALLQLVEAKSMQLPTFQYPKEAVVDGGKTKELSLHWESDSQSVGWHRVSFGFADVEDKVPTRYVRLEFPTV